MRHKDKTMIFQNKTNQKIISFLIIISIMTPVVLFSRPKQANATLCPPGTGVPSSVPVTAPIVEGSTGISCITTVKAWVQKSLELLQIEAAKVLIQKITQSIVNWINEGFHGAPLFLENPSAFFKDVQKTEIKMLVDMFGYDPTRFPFGRDFALNTINAYKSTLEGNAAYSLSKVMTDPVMTHNFINDFSVGGWNGFFINTQYPQNNYIGFQMMANEELARQIAGTVQAPAQKIQDLLQQGQGFLSPQKCMDPNTTYNNGYNEFNRPSFDMAGYIAAHPFPATNDATEIAQWNAALAKAQADWGATNYCKNLVNTTPGTVVGDQVKTSLASSIHQEELATALGNSLAAIIDALVNKLISTGLNELADTMNPEPPVDNWSYGGQTLDGGGSGGGSRALHIPTNVSVNVGETTSTEMSGGKAPYSIETEPDSAIATALISGNTITVTGIASGETSMVITDSSATPKTATVQISVVAPGELMVVPAEITTDTGEMVIATISGGTVPYSLSGGHNGTIAMVALTGTKLVVNGLASGTTSVTITDSSSPTPKTATVPITVGTASAPTQNPTVTITASPPIVSTGGKSILAWTATNATSCSATWTSDTATSGTADVYPTAMTVYDITCTDDNGASATGSVTVYFVPNNS